MRLLLRFLIGAVALCAILAVTAIGAVLAGLWIFGSDLPDYQQLADYDPPVTTRVHAGDGRLIAEFARERRLYVPMTAMPRQVVQAFLAAEDKSFYSHPGINLLAVARAVAQNIANIGQNRRPVGASTITQQVAKNFLLSNEMSLERKIKEWILAFRIERAFSKDRILELYLNEIYLGVGAYGAAAASLYYFDKSLDELDTAEVAYLAALPKAPNNYHPVRYPDRAKARRDWVIERMHEDGWIDAAQMAAAQAKPLAVKLRRDVEIARADYFAEEVRRGLLQTFGERGLYESGLSVRSTMDTRMQRIGERVLRAGLTNYDRRHGWRGPLAHIATSEGWPARLAAVAPVPGLADEWSMAVVIGLSGDGAEIGFADASRGTIPFEELRWARPREQDQAVGPVPRRPQDVLALGDVVPVEVLTSAGGGKSHGLRQIPDVGGGLVAMDPHTGRVLALVGGWDYGRSQFNRATQAIRQPGSAFKPFVYAAALDRGFTPSSLVLDAPFVIDQGPGLPKWKPSNYNNDFLGPATLRVGLEKSRNLMTVRLAQAIGMETIVDYARRFGVVEAMPATLSMALGAGETTVLKLTAAYGQFVNGGKRITPTLIDRIQDRTGRTVFRHDNRPCAGCRAEAWVGQIEPLLPDSRVPTVDPGTAYQIVAMLQGVVERGTGVRIRELDRPLAGKTGTTNDSFDGWFVGFSPDLVVGVYVGFDTPRTLGARETGSSVAVPIFKDFMQAALAGKPSIPFRVPPDIRLVRVDPETGLPTQPGDRKAILEAFKPGSEPTADRIVLEGGEGLAPKGEAGPSVGVGVGVGVSVGVGVGAQPTAGTGGLY